MKKKILFTSLIATLVVACYVFFASSMEKPIARTVKQYSRNTTLSEGMDSAYISELSKIGFGNIEDAKVLKYTTERSRWLTEFGLPFIGDEEMTKFLRDNDFILGPADKYIDIIPVEAGKKMIETLERIKPKLAIHSFHLTHNNLVYMLSENELSFDISKDRRNKSWISTAAMDDYYAMTNIVKPSVIKQLHMPTTAFWTFTPGDVKVNVIAGAKKFNTEGMVIEDGILKAEPPKDPIAVVKVANGYVELANW